MAGQFEVGSHTGLAGTGSGELLAVGLCGLVVAGSSDGLPFVFTDFRIDARIADSDDLDTIFDGGPAPLQPGFVARDETDIMPMELDVMTYGDR